MKRSEVTQRAPFWCREPNFAYISIAVLVLFVVFMTMKCTTERKNKPLVPSPGIETH